MFEVDRVYNRRRDIHALYGGNWQSGICPSRSHPFIFIFSGGSGHNFGYADQWVNDSLYSYTGAGQVGDMEFVRGNKALLTHIESGKRVFLFEDLGSGLSQFKAELRFENFVFDDLLDKNGDIRQAIVFYFMRVDVTSRVGEPSSIYTAPIIYSGLTETEIKKKQRIGQSIYRTNLIYRWDSKCAVSGVGKQEILIASHIKPWKDSEDHERTDVNNGLLLNPTYDALFDKHLIGFEDSGKIILTSKVSDKDYEKLGVNISDRIHSLSAGNKFYLEYHRNQL